MGTGMGRPSAQSDYTGHDRRKAGFFRYRKQPLSNATRRRYRTTLHGFFVWAQSRDLIAYNPVKRTLAPRAESVEIGIISPGDLKKLLQAALDHDKGMLFRLVLAAFCACGAPNVSE